MSCVSTVNIPFQHPATIINKNDITDMKRRLANNVPCTVRGRDKLSWTVQKDYKPHALPKVVCNWTVPATGHAELCDQDGVQVYANTLAFLLWNEDVYAKNALNIVSAWSTTCTGIEGDNRVLEASWSTACFARSMELLKYTYSGYNASGVEAKYIRWLDTVVLPAINAPITWKINNNQDSYSNWTAAKNEALIQVAVFRNDHHLFDQQVALYKAQLPVIIKDSGFENEILRDLMHTQFAIGSLAHVCEIAMNAKGVNLYHESNNRLAKGMEYCAAILQGERNFPEITGKQLNMVDYHPMGAWGLSVMGCECNGIQVPKSRRLMCDNMTREFPWLAWGWYNLTHRKS